MTLYATFSSSLIHLGEFEHKYRLKKLQRFYFMAVPARFAIPSL